MKPLVDLKGFKPKKYHPLEPIVMECLSRRGVVDRTTLTEYLMGGSVDYRASYNRVADHVLKSMFKAGRLNRDPLGWYVKI